MESLKGMPVRNQSRRKGAAIVELSLCLLLVFTIVIAVMEFGRLVFAYTTLAGATREAARYAMVHGSKSTSPATEEDIRAQVSKWAIGLNPASLTVDTTWDPANTPGSRVQIQSSYNFSPFGSLVLSAPIRIGSRTEMVISQ
jgi:Flp pilus assembly protein TadG